MSALNTVEKITVKAALNNQLQELKAAYAHNSEALEIVYERELERVNQIVKKLELDK
jgi:hypothetical protein